MSDFFERPDVEPPRRELRAYRRIRALRYWPERTIGVLSTYDVAPHADPVASLLRAGDRRILFSLHRDSGSLARLRRWPRVALTVLADRDTAFTARGLARVLAESLVGQPDFAALDLVVEAIDDHHQSGHGVGVVWSDERELEALRERISALQWLLAAEAAA